MKEHREFTTESMERRNRPYEVREKEELEYLKESNKTDWILLKQPKNQAGYERTKTALKQKPRRGSYMIQGFSPLVLKIGNAGTTMAYIMSKVKLGCELVCYDVSPETRATAGSDQRISDILSYIEAHGKTYKELTEAKASSKKIKDEFKKAKESKKDE